MSINIGTVISLITKTLRKKGADVDGLELDIQQLLQGASATDLLSKNMLGSVDKNSPVSLILGLLNQRGVDVGAFDFQSLLNLNGTDKTGLFSIDSLFEGDIAKQVRDLNMSELSKVIKIVKEGEKEVKKIAQELLENIMKACNTTYKLYTVSADEVDKICRSFPAEYDSDDDDEDNRYKALVNIIDSVLEDIDSRTHTTYSQLPDAYDACDEVDFQQHKSQNITFWFVIRISDDGVITLRASRLSSIISLERQEEFEERIRVERLKSRNAAKNYKR
jgi:hypothetical protein